MKCNRPSQDNIHKNIFLNKNLPAPVKFAGNFKRYSVIGQSKSAMCTRVKANHSS